LSKIELWKQLQLDEFWRVRLGCSREGTDWEHVLQTLVCYRLLVLSGNTADKT
jgi:hypothetical protein